jgi:hypothetical protein
MIQSPFEHREKFFATSCNANGLSRGRTVVYDNRQQRVALNYLPRNGSGVTNRSLQLQATLDCPEAILLVNLDAKIMQVIASATTLITTRALSAIQKARIPARDRTLDELLAV